MAPVIILILLSLAVFFVIKYRKPVKILLPDNYKKILNDHVVFYQKLNKNNQALFEKKLNEFLNYVTIEGVNTEAGDVDKILVGTSAVIPVFYFDQWKYYNIDTVLLYPGTFNRDEFLAEGHEKNTLGMVGNGPMQRIMILSKPALYYGFEHAGRHHTGIHEFVHLLDKEDGDVDGLPEALLGRHQNAQWLQLVEKNMEAIMRGHSDIDLYGATNKAEFFSVAAEYFFNDPENFKENHAELNEMLCEMFQVPKE